MDPVGARAQVRERDRDLDRGRLAAEQAVGAGFDVDRVDADRLRARLQGREGEVEAVVGPRATVYLEATSARGGWRSAPSSYSIAPSAPARPPMKARIASGAVGRLGSKAQPRTRTWPGAGGAGQFE